MAEGTASPIAPCASEANQKAWLPEDRGNGEFAAWALFLSLVLNTASAGLVPLAAEDNSLTFGGIRLADVLVATAVLFAALKGVPGGGLIPFGAIGIWTAWTLLTVLGSGAFSLYRLLSEWQMPVYLLASWLVISSLGTGRWHVWLKRAIRAQTSVVVAAAVWAMITQQAGADIATIGCVVAMMAVASSVVSPIERLLAVIAAVVLIGISAQRATFLLLLLLTIAGAVWSLKWNREQASRLVTMSVVGASMLVPGLLALSLASGAYEKVPQYIEYAFFRQAKQLSVDSRLAQWRIALNDIQDSPLVGHGVGGTVVEFRDPGVDRSTLNNITHNIALDLLLRFGVPVGCLILVTLVLIVMGRMVAAWNYGSFALWMCAWSVVGLLAKGMVESIFFKPRLVPLLAVLIAVLIVHRHWAPAHSSRR